MCNIRGVTLLVILLSLFSSGLGTFPILAGVYDFIVVGAGASGSVVAARYVFDCICYYLLLLILIHYFSF